METDCPANVIAHGPRYSRDIPHVGVYMEGAPIATGRRYTHTTAYSNKDPGRFKHTAREEHLPIERQRLASHALQPSALGS